MADYDRGAGNRPSTVGDLSKESIFDRPELDVPSDPTPTTIGGTSGWIETVGENMVVSGFSEEGYVLEGGGSGTPSIELTISFETPDVDPIATWNGTGFNILRNGFFLVKTGNSIVVGADSGTIGMAALGNTPNTDQEFSAIASEEPSFMACEATRYFGVGAEVVPSDIFNRTDEDISVVYREFSIFYMGGPVV